MVSKAQLMFREGSVLVELTWNTIILLLKGRGYYMGIVLKRGYGR